jgi:CRISPR-associated protein Cas5d
MNGGNDLAYYTYLRDVKYQISAHFEWNESRENLKNDRDYKKHGAIAKRSIERGGRRDIFLGTRECQGYVETCEYGEGKGFYDDYGDLEFGVMFHGFDYPDESGCENWEARLWRAKMHNGEIVFPCPSDIPAHLRRTIRPMGKKTFTPGVDFLDVFGEYAEVMSDELAE